MEVWAFFHLFFLAFFRKIESINKQKFFTIRFIWVISLLGKILIGFFVDEKTIFSLKNFHLKRIFQEIVKEYITTFVFGSWFINFLYLSILRNVFSFFHRKRIDLFPLSL